MTTKMPEPTGRAGVLCSRRSAAYSIPIDGRTVLFQYDDGTFDGTVYVRIVDIAPGFDEMMKPIGRIAVSAQFGEGTVVAEEWATALGAPEDRALALRGLPWLYTATDDRAERKAMRALYHRLAGAPVAAS